MNGVDTMNQRGNVPMVNMGLRIDAETKETLETLAKANRRSLSEFVRIILEDYAAEHKSELGN